MLTPKGVYWELAGDAFRRRAVWKNAGKNFLWMIMFCGTRMCPLKKCIEREKKWKEQNEKLQTEMETFSKEASENAENILNQVQIENRNRYD